MEIVENQTYGESLLENFNSTSIISFLNFTQLGNISQYIVKASSTKHDWIVVPSIFAFIFMVGVLGNGILILIVAVNRNMKTTPNVLLVSLATGDLLLIVVSSPFTSIYYFYDEWPFGGIICKLNEFLVTLSLGVSVFTLTALSGERYMVIAFPMQLRRGANSMAKAVMIAVAIWIISALLASLDLFMAEVAHSNGTNWRIISTCNPYPMETGYEWYAKFYTIFRFLVYFLIPIIIIATFYIFMAVILFKSSNNMPGEVEVKGRTIKQVEARKNVARIVLACVLIFILCWLPRHVYMFWFYFDSGQYNMFWHIFKIFGFCLAFMNSCVNPFALYFLSDQFRRYYNRYLFRRLCCCFLVLCRKSTNMGEGTPDDETMTSRGRSVLEMIGFKARGVSRNYNNDNDKTRTTKPSVATAASTAEEASTTTAGRLMNKFVILEGRRSSHEKKQRNRRSTNTANGKILQKFLQLKRKQSEVDVDVDTKMTGHSSV